MNARVARAILWAAAMFALLWAIARAGLQSITIDEAVSYLVFVRPAGSHWYPAANNHLLNTLLERLATLLFGVHHLTVRLPALIGAALYITASLRLARRIATTGLLQIALFVCLVYNPFVFDYLVAARGYGLALGFLMWALALAVESPPLASACLGLSLAANLSFGIVDGIALAFLAISACRRAQSAFRPLLATLLPAAIVTLLLPASMLLRMPKKELWFGAKSLSETFSGVVDASLYRLNPEFVSPLIAGPLESAKTFLPWLLAFTFAACAIYHLRNPRALSRALLPAAVLIAAIAVHWVAFHAAGLLLPKDRTGLYIAPVALLSIGAVAALPSQAALGRALSLCLTLALLATAGYFSLCLRLDAFKEWDFDADVQDLYSVLACLNHDRGVRDVGTFWMYATPLNFYRVQSGRETFLEFQGEVPYRPEQQVLVLNAFREQPEIAAQGLKILYHAKSTDAVIVARPESEASLRSSICLARPLP